MTPKIKVVVHEIQRFNQIKWFWMKLVFMQLCIITNILNTFPNSESLRDLLDRSCLWMIQTHIFNKFFCHYVNNYNFDFLKLKFFKSAKIFQTKNVKRSVFLHIISVVLNSVFSSWNYVSKEWPRIIQWGVSQTQIFRIFPYFVNQNLNFEKWAILTASDSLQKNCN